MWAECHRQMMRPKPYYIAHQGRATFGNSQTQILAHDLGQNQTWPSPPYMCA